MGKKSKDGAKAKPRSKSAASWGNYHGNRLDKPIKTMENVYARLKTANPPGEWNAFGSALNVIKAKTAALKALPADWVPKHTQVKKGQPAPDALVRIKDDSIPYYEDMGGALLWEGSKVIGSSAGDNKYWLVLCTDGTKRLLKKKHAALYVAPVETEDAAAA